jgi:hypothetical protein
MRVVRTIEQLGGRLLAVVLRIKADSWHLCYRSMDSSVTTGGPFSCSNAFQSTASQFLADLWSKLNRAWNLNRGNRRRQINRDNPAATGGIIKRVTVTAAVVTGSTGQGKAAAGNPECIGRKAIGGKGGVSHKGHNTKAAAGRRIGRQATDGPEDRGNRHGQGGRSDRTGGHGRRTSADQIPGQASSSEEGGQATVGQD